MTTVSVISGFLIDYFDRHRMGNLQGWQMMFRAGRHPFDPLGRRLVVHGRRPPHRCRWLTAEEAQAIEHHLEEEQRDIKPIRDYWAAFGELARHPSVDHVFRLEHRHLRLCLLAPDDAEKCRGADQFPNRAACGTAYLLAACTMVYVSILADRL